MTQQDPNANQRWDAPPQWDLQPGNPQSINPPPYRQLNYVAPPKPGVVPLRPLMFGEILDGSFQTIRRNAQAMLGAALLTQALGTIIAALATAFAPSSPEAVSSWLQSQSNVDLTALGIGLLGGVLLFAVLTIFISAVLQGAMVVPVARAILNRRTGFRQMWALSRSRAGALIRLACIVVFGSILAGTVLVIAGALLSGAIGGRSAFFIIPLGLGACIMWLWIYIRLLVAPAAVVVEEVGALEGIRRSWMLTRSNWWRIFGIAMVVGITVAVMVQIVTIPVSLLAGFLTEVVAPHGGDDRSTTIAVATAVVTAVVAAIVGAVGSAFQTSVMALLYMDLRMRKVGLDIDLHRLLETGADPDGVPGRAVRPLPG